MRSKGGKVEWLCPFCKSADISRCSAYYQVSFFCSSCLHFGPWRQRLKTKVSMTTNTEEKSWKRL